MKEMLTKDPLLGPSMTSLLIIFHYLILLLSVKVRDRVLETELITKYEDDPSFVRDVLSELPERVENTLQNHKTRLLGGSHLNVPRDEYNPSALLSQISGGQNVIVLDSLKEECLPSGWKDVDPQSLFVPAEQHGHGGGDDVHPELQPDAGPDAGLDAGVIPPHDPLNGTIADNFGDSEEHSERVLVFTTLYLLSLLTLVKSGNIYCGKPESSKVKSKYFYREH